MSIGIIVQARLGSSRLPNKMVEPFYNGKGVLELLLDKIRSQLPDILIVVATTTNPIDDKIQNLCESLQINFYRGSEDNVLQRFIDTAKKYKIEKIIRVCADNPFLDIPDLKVLIQNSINSNADYLSFQTSDYKPTIQTHYGFWAEMVRLKALEKVIKLTLDKTYLEHVTNYIYLNPEEFNLELITISKSIEKKKNIRMTLDTIEDFKLLKEIYLGYPYFKDGVESLVKIIAKNKTWLKTMESQIMKNTK